MTKELIVPPKTAVLGKKLYIEKKYIDRDILIENYETKFFEESMCQKCPYLEERFGLECESCSGYKGTVVLWDKEKIGGKSFISLPPVHLRKVKELFNLPELDILDIRPYVPMDNPIKFTGTLYTGEKIHGIKTVNQVKVIKKWMKRKSGVIEAPPGSGKTVMAVAITCMLKVKTVIIVEQTDYARQFYETFVGGRKRKAMTDYADKKDVGNYIKIINSPKDFNNIDDVDVIIVNYQKFIRNKKAVKRIRDYLNKVRTLCIVDEVHGSAAPAYAKFISRLKAPYRLGLSATPNRKDNRSLIIFEYIGDVTAKARVQSYIPEIYITQTNYKYNTYKLWVFAMKALAKTEDRNRKIVKMAKRDLKDGKHTGIIIPVDFLDHAGVLQDLFNESLGEGSARIFSQKCDRDRTLDDFDAGEYPVLIAIRKMIKQNIDLSRPSLLYIIIPMSAKLPHGAPMFYQLSNRIGRRAENKPQPIVRIFVDKLGQSQGCFQSLFWKEIFPNSKGKHRKYIIPPETYETAKKLSAAARKPSYQSINQTKSIFL